jgi:hypothetical protein
MASNCGSCCRKNDRGIWNGSEVPADPVYEKEIALADLAENEQNFIEFDSVITASDTFFAGYTLFYNLPQDTFSTYMAGNRTFQPVNTAYVSNNGLWLPVDQYTGGMVNTSFGIMPVVFDSLPDENPDGDFPEEVIAYPNPAADEIWIELRWWLPVQLEIFNIQGQRVTVREYGRYQRLIRLTSLNLGNGLYVIRVKRDSRVTQLKVAIMK